MSLFMDGGVSALLSSRKYFMCTYYVPGTVLGTGKMAETCKTTQQRASLCNSDSGREWRIGRDHPLAWTGQRDQGVLVILGKALCGKQTA